MNYFKNRHRRKQTKKDVAVTKTDVLEVKTCPKMEAKIRESASKRLMPAPKRTSAGMKFPPEILTLEEAQALIRACSRSSPTGVRNRAMIAVFLGTGARCSEVLGLRVIDLDIEHGSVHIMRGKRSKDRVVGISPGAVAILEQWLAKRQEIGIRPTAPLFCALKDTRPTEARPWSGERGERLSTAYVRAFLWKLSRRAGISRRVHAHMFRHTFAAGLRRRGVDIGKISKQLGHANIATTAHYVDHLCPSEIIEAVNDLPWEYGE